jgi:serine/threonine protein phosphatase PrpC
MGADASVLTLLLQPACLPACCRQTQNCTNSGSALAKAAAMSIMNAAMEAGSHDNITVVAMLLDWGGEYATD